MEAHETASNTSAGCSTCCAMTIFPVRPQDPGWLPTGGDGSVHGVPLALAVCRRVLHAWRGAWKGRVEGEGGYFRRNHLVPVPCVADLDALNALLLIGCRADEARVLDGRTQSVGAALTEERSHLLSRVTEGFDLAD